jgi:hypothetical protein
VNRAVKEILPRRNDVVISPSGGMDAWSEIARPVLQPIHIGE